MTEPSQEADAYDAPDARARILEAASELVERGGVAALTTRAVAAAASVQAPTLYRLFRDKRGLLDAVAERELAAFVARKVVRERHPDPVQNLREAWNDYVAFGVGHPAVFAIMSEVGRAAPPSPATLAGMSVLRERVECIAHAGRLRVPVHLATSLIHAAGLGTVATLLATPQGQHDRELSALALEALLAVLVEGGSESREVTPAALAIGLLANLDGVDILSPGERLLMEELLCRLAR